ncbi:MAG: hypothetical protein HXS48_11020 [Theionarchaea archaeon]|nr:hypothetical protein [Theionarchaea archaeon]
MTLRERVMDKLRMLAPRKLSAKEIALSGVMAAVMAVAAFIPVTVVAGVGKVISAAVMLEPLVGVLLGPILGTYAAAAGAFVGQVLAPHGAIFGLLTFIPPTVGAATAGLLAHKHWKAASGVMVAVLLLWYSTSIGRELYYYPYMPLIFLGLALLFRGHLGEWIHVKYDEIIGFGRAGIRVMVVGIALVIAAEVVVFAGTADIVIGGVTISAAALVVLLCSLLKENDFLRKSSGVLFIAGGIVIVLGIAVQYGVYLTTVTAVLYCVAVFFLGLTFLGYRYSRRFVESFVLFGVAALILMIRSAKVQDDYLLQILFEKISYALLIVGCILFSAVHFQDRLSLKKWSGLTLFLAGFAGLIQRFLLLSLESQVIRKELLRLEELIPFSTSVLGKEIDITSVFDYYTKNVFPVYAGHIGWFLIFVAIIILGVSFFLNISLEKLSVAYFVISGFAVLSDLMIGNFLAVQVLELNVGIFKAFLFIYPVERMFMAFFATIFGVGVIIPLKRYGLTNLIRR